MHLINVALVLVSPSNTPIVRSISRSQKLNLGSIAYLRTCNISTSVNGLSHKWWVLINQVELLPIQSVSLDPKIFTLSI